MRVQDSPFRHEETLKPRLKKTAAEIICVSRISKGKTYVNSKTGTGTVDLPVKPILHLQA